MPGYMVQRCRYDMKYKCKKCKVVRVPMVDMQCLDCTGKSVEEWATARAKAPRPKGARRTHA